MKTREKRDLSEIKHPALKSFLCTGLLIVLFYAFYKLCYDTNLHFYPKSLAFGAFLLLLLFLFLLGICKKVHIANLVLGILFMIIMTINCVKMYFTNDPILFTDIHYLSDIGEILSIADDSFTFSFVTMILPALIYIGVNVLIIIRGFRYRYSVKLGWRIGFAVAPVIIFAILLNPSQALRKALLANIYNIYGNSNDRVYSSNITLYGRNGIASGMYSHFLQNRIEEPENYDAAALQKLAESTPQQADRSFGTPNIIVIFAESFFDLDRVSDITFDKKITSNYNRLKEEGVSFEMISPTFGSVSANVEFEFLTGANLSYFSNGYVPYMQLYTNNQYYNVPSVLHELKNNDYYTKVIAYTGPRLYNCGKFYAYAGVDDPEFIYEIPELKRYIPDEYKKGPNVSDEHVVDEIIKEFDSKKPGQREFYMVLTMQAHTPYTRDKYDTYDINVTKSTFNESMNDALRSYAQGIYDTDQQLNRLYEYIQTLDEPTVIVFYGDHLPQIADQYGTSMLDCFDYFNTDDERLNLYRKYNTQGLILANFEIEQPDYQYASPDLLSAYLLNHMDIQLSDYYRWLYSNLDVLPSMNKYIARDTNGNIYYISDMPDKLTKQYQLRNAMQYYYFINEYQR